MSHKENYVRMWFVWDGSDRTLGLFCAMSDAIDAIKLSNNPSAWRLSRLPIVDPRQEKTK